VAELQQHPAVAHVTADEGPDLPLNVRLKDGGEQRLFLKNTYFETRELPPEEKLAAVRRLLDSLSMSHELSWDDAAPAIVPLVRITTFGGGLAENLVTLPLAPFVRIFLGVDRETASRRQSTSWWRGPSCSRWRPAVWSEPRSTSRRAFAPAPSPMRKRCRRCAGTPSIDVLQPALFRAASAQ
jgi:hypothetical protein